MMSMKKEPITFVLTLALLGGLVWLGGSSGTSSTGRRGGGGTPPPDEIAAKPAPGRFVKPDVSTWSSEGRNPYEAPVETRELPPLELAPPVMPRSPVPAPVLPFDLGGNIGRTLRRPWNPTASGAAPAAPAPASETNEAPPAPSAEGVVPTSIDGALGLADRLRMSAADRIRREEEQRRAEESEADRRKRLDRITFTNGQTALGEFMAADRNKNRWDLIAEYNALRGSTDLSEIARTEKMKALKVAFREDKKGRLLARTVYTADVVAEIVLADNPVNRFETRRRTLKPDDAAGALDAVRGVFDAKEYALCVEFLEGLRKKGERAIDVFVMLSDCREALFDYDAEMSVLRDGLAVHPGATPLLARKARLELRLGLRDEAAATAREAMAKGADAVAAATLGEALLRTGKARDAISPLRDALASSDGDKAERIRTLLAEAYLAVGDLKNAEGQLDVVMDRWRRATTAGGGGDAERQRAHERAVALSVTALIAGGKIEEAKTAVAAASTIFPASGVLTYLSGAAKLLSGDVGGARAAFALVPELDPLLAARVGAASAAVEEQSGKDDAALGVAATAAGETGPSDPALRPAWGRALLMSGDPVKARDVLLGALDASPDDPDLLSALGDAAYAEGDLARAARFYDRLATVEPGFPGVGPRRLLTAVRRRRMADADALVAKASAADLKDPAWLAATAFHQYQKSNEGEALQIMQRVSESASKGGSLSAWASSAYAAITAQRSKLLWSDGFSRSGTQIGREWKKEIGAGVAPALADQKLVFEGQQRTLSDKPTIVWQERQGDRFVAFGVDLDVAKQQGVYAGIALVAMNQGRAGGEKWPGFPEDRPAGYLPWGGVQVAFSPEGRLVWRRLEKGKMTDWEPTTSTFAGGVVNLEIRWADPREGRVDVLANKEVVASAVLQDIRNWKRTFELWVFSQAALDQKVSWSADNATIVTTKEK